MRCSVLSHIVKIAMTQTHVLLPRPSAANWANAATCNLCQELLRHVRTWQPNLLEPSSSKTEHPANVLRMSSGYWMTSSQTSELVELNQSLGHLVRLWPHWATLYGVTLKWLCFHRNHIFRINLRLGSQTHFMKSSESSEIVYGFECCVLNDGGHIDGWKFERYCLKIIKIKVLYDFAVCLRHVYIQSY